MVSLKQKTAARKNLKKARKKWMKMSHKARKAAMPSRPYKVHTKRWHNMVRKLRREGKVKSPEAVATAKLGPKSFLKRRKK